MPMSLIIFAHDPGSTNYGFSIVEAQKLKNGPLRYRVLENGLMPYRIHNLKDHKVRREEASAYKEFCRSKIETFGAQVIIGERYMTRGISGPTIESVNMMLGLLQSFQLRDRFVPAAVWKNAVTRSGIDLKSKYKLCLTAPHQLDASLIGVWGAHQAYGVKDFGDMNEGKFEKLMYQIEETSIDKLYKRKTRQ